MLSKIIENLIEERLFNISYQKTRDESDYDKWQEESISLGANIMVKLGSERSLFMTYEELAASSESVLLQNAYRQGFLDGLEFLFGLLYRKNKC